MTAEASESKLKQYSLKEVGEHKSRQSIWVVIHDKIYDVTNFINEVLTLPYKLLIPLFLGIHLATFGNLFAFFGCK